MRTSDFDYHLPEHLIAQTPLEPRDHSRLLVVDTATGDLSHRHFYDIGHFLQPGDLLVLNNSRVLPARLRGRRPGTGGAVEVLLLHREDEGLWKAMVRPGRRLGPGAAFEIDGVSVDVLEDLGDGTRLIRMSDEGVIRDSGEVPLPPYIHTPLADGERYQTVYASAEGSAAAPTAGLHFTPELLAGLRLKGVRLAQVTLHVGIDTFRPVRSEQPGKHKLHSEYFQLGEQAAREINQAKADWAPHNLRRYYKRTIAGAGGAARRRTGVRDSRRRIRMGGPVYPARASLPTGRWSHNKLPPAQIHTADARISLRRARPRRGRGQGDYPAGLPRGHRGRLPLLQLWGLHDGPLGAPGISYRFARRLLSENELCVGPNDVTRCCHWRSCRISHHNFSGINAESPCMG